MHIKYTLLLEEHFSRCNYSYVNYVNVLNYKGYILHKSLFILILHGPNKQEGDVSVIAIPPGLECDM